MHGHPAATFYLKLRIFDFLERKFDNIKVSALSAKMASIEKLRAAIQERQAPTLSERSLAVDAALAPLFHGGGLRLGSSYEVHGPLILSLLMASRATREGSWIALVGFPQAGVEAMSELGVDLRHVILIPHPQDSWLSVASILVGAVDILILNPEQRSESPASTAPSSPKASASSLSRFNAQLRQSDCVLLTHSTWPLARGVLRARTTRWSGLSAGRGRLNARYLQVTARAHGEHRERRLTVCCDPLLHQVGLPPMSAGLGGMPLGTPIAASTQITTAAG